MAPLSAPAVPRASTMGAFVTVYCHHGLVGKDSEMLLCVSLSLLQEDQDNERQRQGDSDSLLSLLPGPCSPLSHGSQEV